ncbi:hypothetical protein [Spirillospora sp. NPDC048819]|uniref:hypothetical protein n=1 Tax=Spirillospora sp. NPDC048819 TaxID=3155268 RepID=UPI0033C796C0
MVDARQSPTFADEGLRAALEARRRIPDVSVLVLSQHVEQSCTRGGSVLDPIPSAP